MDKKLKILPGESEQPSKYGELLKGIVENPSQTYVYVPFQEQPNLPKLKINTIKIDGRTLYHGLASQSTKGLKCIPIFSELDEVKPSYGQYFEMIFLPINRVADLITEDSSAQGLMLDMFSLNIILDKEYIYHIKGLEKPVSSQATS